MRKQAFFGCCTAAALDHPILPSPRPRVPASGPLSICQSLRLSFSLSLLLAGLCAAAESPYFKITVVDDQTGRGVPLVELQTTNNVRYYTDSNGIVAFDEPGLMNQTVFFSVKSHGYEFPKDGFGMTGRQLQVTPGGSAELRIKRLNIAERLYRITGGGIYRDSILTGTRVPTTQPVLNAKVLGQDSVMNAAYGGKLYWFWGDTNWPAYPLGNFNMSGATSDGRLDPDRGVDLHYFVGENGFARAMAPVPGDGPTWTVAPIVVKSGGRERMFSAYNKIKADGSMATWQRGMTEWNDEKQVFEKIAEWPLEHPVVPSGHVLMTTWGAFFTTPYPLVRVRAEPEAIKDVTQYEAFTPLKAGTRIKDGQIDRDAAGQVRYGWKRNTAPVGPSEQAELIKNGKLKPEEGLLQLQDVDTGTPVLAHAGTVCWNAYRGRWIMITCQVFGTSMLGEMWYAEADTPLGPWVYARKVVTHDKYSFYNPKQHPEFDHGLIIYFEGTYTATFSGATEQTPRYDYNQIMYKLDLADPRLVLPVPVYRTYALPDFDLLTRDEVRLYYSHHGGNPDVAFFASARPAPGLIPIYTTARGLASQPAPGDLRLSPHFWALPLDAPNPPKSTVVLYKYMGPDARAINYSAEPERRSPDVSEPGEPLCRVWRNPMTFSLPVDYIVRVGATDWRPKGNLWPAR